jgi:photoactive yellow protein
MTSATPTFDDRGLADFLAASNQEQIDALDFGVIGFDADATVQRYNAFESQAAGLSPQRVMGEPLFTNVAPCLNNFMVAQRFEDAADDGSDLLTLRMRPVKVKLRLLASAGSAVRYVLVQRR